MLKRIYLSNVFRLPYLMNFNFMTFASINKKQNLKSIIETLQKKQKFFAKSFIISSLKKIPIKLILIRKGKSCDNIPYQNIDNNCTEHRNIQNKNKPF